MSKRRRLVIREITRFPNEDPGDTLEFDEGVNVIVGVPNTGKSKWLRMIDFVLGYDKSPAEAFSEELAIKYHSIRAVLDAGEKGMVVFRQWDDPKLATKIQVDGEWMTIHSFTLKLLEALEIPVLHYPQGNPYGTRTWPELGWRSLIRHVYRRQLLWSNLADNQPESEQHACLLQFVGIAEHLFSKEYGELVTSEKQIQKLQNDRGRFIETLQEVSRDLIDEKELGVAMTPASIANAMSRHQSEINELEGQKRQALAAALRPVAGDGRVHVTNSTNERLGGELAAARGRQTANFTALRKARDRYQELTSYKEAIEGELAAHEAKKVKKLGRGVVDSKEQRSQKQAQNARSSVDYSPAAQLVMVSNEGREDKRADKKHWKKPLAPWLWKRVVVMQKEQYSGEYQSQKQLHDGQRICQTQ